MELRHLRSFVAVAEELHFSRAARRLHIEQPALSQQIRQLERELGATLFERTTRRVELTVPGSVLLERARRVLDTVERGVSDTRRAARGELGWLVIGFVDSAAYTLLPPILRELRRRAPDLALDLRELSTDAQLAGLRDDVDVGIVRDAGTIDGLIIDPLLAEPLVVAVPSVHPLAARSQLALAELAGQPFVSFPRDHVPHIHDRLIDICHTVGGFGMRVAHHALQYPTILGLVAADYGVALVPTSLQLLQHPGVVFIEVTDEAVDSQLAIARRIGNDAPAVGVFTEITRTAISMMAS